jgi:hypothetical protein
VKLAAETDASEAIRHRRYPDTAATLDATIAKPMTARRCL